MFKLAPEGARRRAAWPSLPAWPTALLDVARARTATRSSSPTPTASRRSRPPTATTSPRSSSPAARHRAAAAGARDTVDLSQHGRGGDHDLGLPARPRARWRDLLGFAERAGELLRLHRRRRLRHRDLRARSSSCSSTSAGSSRTCKSGPGFEVGQLHVPDAFVQISSIMPQKRNPVPIEHCGYLASLAGGRGRDAMLDDHAQHALHRHERQRGREPDRRLRARSRPAGACSTCSRRCCRRCTIDADEGAAEHRRSCITVTELADIAGARRRDSRSARRTRSPREVARAVVQTGRRCRRGRLRGVPAARSSAAPAARPRVDEADFARDRLARSISSRCADRYGGPAPARARRQPCRLSRARLADKRRRIDDDRRARSSGGQLTCEAAFASLLRAA